MFIVIQFKGFCPDTQTQTNTESTALLHH